MKVIELDIWEPVPDRPGYVRYVEGRIAADVFEELRQRLDNIGYLPDEYFLMDNDWEKGRKIPKDAWPVINVDYGSNEGIYLEVTLRWDEEREGGKREKHTESYITGKTLGESPSHMDRMNLIASAIRQAFHEDGVYARYVIAGAGKRRPAGMTAHLTSSEIGLMVNSLLDTRIRYRNEGLPLQDIERLLRRFLGSITEYMQTVGERPAGITDQDAITLAVLENNMTVFQELLPKTLALHHELLVLVAGQPGRIADEMTQSLLDLVREVPRDTYEQAIARAIRLNDIRRVTMLLANAETRTDDHGDTLYAQAIKLAMQLASEGVQGTYIAGELSRRATPEQLSAADPFLIVRAVQNRDECLALLLLRSSVDFKQCQPDLYYAIAAFHCYYLFEALQSYGGDINARDFGALRICLRCCAVETAITLMEHDADYRGFRATVDEKRLSKSEKIFMEALDKHVALKETKNIHPVATPGTDS